LEDLNFRGGDVSFPPLADSPLNPNTGFQAALWRYGVALRDITVSSYAQNLLKAPVPADQQVYIGQRPYETLCFLNPILTWDLRQLGLEHAQLNLGANGYWTSWEPAGPKAIDLWTLFFYKEFAGDRVEFKAGYTSNDNEFLGMQVGGSSASGVQGVYAVLPYEVGMSFWPLTSPFANLAVHGPSHLYLRTGLQRSLDAAGAEETERRNHSGLRFDPKGDKLLAIEEAGYRRPSSDKDREFWFRTGYLRNSTLYTDMANGKQEPGNHAAFALADYQLTRPDIANPWQGTYLGASAMTAASKFNPYDRYYELRLYQLAPFRKRPGDNSSLVATYTAHSRYFTDPLVAKGDTVWRNGASITGTYNFHLCPGNYLAFGLSYLTGPTLTPRVDAPLTVSTLYQLFF
jgi:porin